MSRSVNKVILVGNVGKDPEVTYTPSGIPVAKFSLATNEKYRDRAGEWQERVEWHHLIAWQRLAEIVGEYVQQGSKLYIEGKLQTSSWEDKQSGERKYHTEIVALELLLLGSARNDKEQGAPGRYAHRERQPERTPAYAGVPDITDEAIPF